MLANAKSGLEEEAGDEDALLLADEGVGQAGNQDICAFGEKIADNLTKLTAKNPNILFEQLEKLDLVFEEQLIVGLSNVARVAGVEGVEIVSQEEMEAIVEGANAKASAMPDAVQEEFKSSLVQPSSAKLPAQKVEEQFDHLDINPQVLTNPQSVLQPPSNLPTMNP